MKVQEEEYLAHYGILRRSGRYPWGSGGHNETGRSKTWLDYVDDLKAQGVPEKTIAKGFDMTINQLRASRSIASNQQKQSRIALHQRLHDKGYSNSAISRRTGSPESTVRSDLVPGAKDKADVIQNTANTLRSHIKSNVYLDVGRGTENHLGVSRTRMDTALEVLKQEGYKVISLRSPQATGIHSTNMKVLTEGHVKWADVFYNQERIVQPVTFSDDGGRHYGSPHEPLKLDPKRIEVIYGPEGGAKADGMIYVRPGVEDVAIGGAQYAQVRIAVGDDHYLKGMAIYKEGLPAGVDIQFNTNKTNTGNSFDAMKKNSEEKGYVPNGPHILLKSVKRQILSEPGTPNERVTSVMNLVNEEGKWEEWSHELSSQMLSKQNPVFAKTQLAMTYERNLNNFEEIDALTNQTVRKRMLNDFADATAAESVHLQAASLPRTSSHVILPIPSMPKNQIYAPNYQDGERVILIRHPHGGTFEIPELIVNNKHREARRLLGKEPRDAVGINHEIAQWLSGADFDGDTVLVIPNKGGLIKNSRPLDALKNFDPRSDFAGYPGMPIMRNTQAEMGNISNLITDMSIKEAPLDEIARAVKHSMVVIDAEKHKLNYKLSENDNGIRQLKEKYQGGPRAGAATLISRSNSQARIPQRRLARNSEGGPIDPVTGAQRFTPTGRLRRNGKPVTEKTTKGAIATDARTLMSTPTGTPMERVYADHANRLKALSNQARLAAFRTPTPKPSASAKKTYHKEVQELDAALDLAQRNAPLERQAHLIANARVKATREANPHLDDDTLKKIQYQALVQARIRTGAQRHMIRFTPEQWDAIQAGAISDTKLTKILQQSDMDHVRALATPQDRLLMTPTKTSRARQMLDAGYTRAEVASQLGVSLSTLDASTK